jgi:flagellar biosynthesis/type III secretory pathway ATPase
MTAPAQGVVQNEPLTRAPCTGNGRAIVLERNIAECGRCRANDSLETVSRTMPGRNASEEQILALTARAPRPLYEDRTEPIRRRRDEIGTNTEVDLAIKLYRLLEASQKKVEWASFTDCYAAPAKIVGRTAGKGDGS